MILRCLLAVSKPALKGRIRRLLASQEVVLSAVADTEALWEALGAGGVDLIITSRRALDADPAEVATRVRALPEPPEVIVVTDRDTEDERARLAAAGCLAVLSETLDNRLLGEALQALSERRRTQLVERLRAPSAERVPRLSNFVSESTSMAAFLRVARRVAPTDTTVLITGETGVGKEWLARAMHADSPRAAAPFVAVNCGALPDTLLESELFGHTEGAFTGATRARRGMFELAHGGSLFLDEVGDMPLHLQVKLLRALQERSIQPLGAETAVPVDVRIMAATNRDLAASAAAGEFRRDLFYRLGVVTLEVPPLRERRDDIADLVRSYIEHFQARIRQDVDDITPAAQQLLESYDWPGNVRELINVIERAMILSDGPVIDVEALPEDIARQFGPLPPAAGAASDPGAEHWLDEPLADARARVVDAFERRYLDGWLRRTKGRVGDTAAAIGITSRALYDKMRRLGLAKEDYRRPAS